MASHLKVGGVRFVPQETSTTTASGNLNAALAYFGIWVTGIIFLLVEKEDDLIRFHAGQSVVVFGVLTLIAMIPAIGWVLSPFIGLVGIVLWIVLMVKAYNGERFALPIAGELAEKLERKIK